MFTRLRSEAGQTAAEFLGILLLVGTVIAAVALTGIGNRIAFHTKILVCQIGGGENCEA